MIRDELIEIACRKVCERNNEDPDLIATSYCSDTLQIPDWFYVGGIIVVLVAGILAIGDQARTLIRKVRKRREVLAPYD